MKKILLSLISVGLALGGASANAAEFTAICNSQTGEINISMKTDGYDNPILFYLLDNRDETTSPDAVTSENIKEKIKAFAESTGVSGEHTAKLILTEGIETGQYTVVMEDYSAVDDVPSIPLSERQLNVYVASEELVSEALKALNNATAANINDVILKYKDVIGITLDKNYNETAAEVFLNLKTSDFTKFEEIYPLFDKAVAAGAILKADESTMGAMLEKFASELGIELDEDYSAYSGDIHELLVNAFEGFSIDGDCIENIADAVKEMTAVAAVNNSNRSDMDSVLNKYNDILGLDLDGIYDTSDKVEFNKALERKGFANAKDVKKAFDAAASALEKKNNTPSGGGSSSGGGGSSSGASMVPAPYVPQEEKDEKETKYNDLDDAQWAKEAVYALTELGIVSGYDDGSFGPSKQISRNEFVTMLVRAFDLLDESAEYSFKDGSPEAWYAKYIASAHKAGVVAGYDDGTFGDGELIKRQDMAVMIMRVAKISSQSAVSVFDDDAKISDYAKDAVYTLNAKGIINGMGNNMFEPAGAATRAQAAKMIYSVIGGGSSD